jgi:hypothetical protein
VEEDLCDEYRCDESGELCTQNGWLAYQCDDTEQQDKLEGVSATQSYVCNCRGPATIPETYVGTDGVTKGKACGNSNSGPSSSSGNGSGASETAGSGSSGSQASVTANSGGGSKTTGNSSSSSSSSSSCGGGGSGTGAGTVCSVKKILLGISLGAMWLLA